MLDAADAVAARASAIFRFRFRLAVTAGLSTPRMSVLLPEPEMPVTTLNRPIGKSHIDVLEIVQIRALQLRASASRPSCCGARRASDASAARADICPVAEAAIF